MSKHRLQIESIIDTLPHAITIRDNIVLQLVGKDIFENHGISSFISQNGSIRVTADIRFNKITDRDSVKDWIKNKVSDDPIIKNWVFSARVISHLCTHDSKTVLDCRTTDFVEWKKI